MTPTADLYINFRSLYSYVAEPFFGQDRIGIVCLRLGMST